MKVSDLLVQSYLIESPSFKEGKFFEITLERVNQKDGSDKWAIRRPPGGMCFGKKGWEYEPLGSQRDAAFMKRCRFNTPEGALKVYTAFMKKSGGKNGN